MSSRTPPISIDGPFGWRMTHRLDTSNVLCVHRVSSCDKRRVTIDILPDDVLLLVFRLDRETYFNGLECIEKLYPFWRWHRLVHVCRRWRSVVFASPKFLDLRLIFKFRTRLELTSIWPPFPIIIRNFLLGPMPETYDIGAVIAQHNRICEIELVLSSSHLQRLASAMQEQFPALTRLRLSHWSRHLAPALPDLFLGGFAPRLQYLGLDHIPFPALPRLLLSATDLVYLYLQNVPHSGCMSPEAIVTGLAVSANLKYLFIEFESPQFFPDRESRRPPPPTRAVLPALTRFVFKGFSEWLEDLVARIDAPLLDTLWITFFHQLILDVLQLAQFMRRTTMFQALDEAHLGVDHDFVQVGSLPLKHILHKGTALKIACDLDQQLSSLVQVITSLFPSIYVVENLYIHAFQDALDRWEDDTENTPMAGNFPSTDIAQRIAPALKGLVGERVRDVLPALKSLFLEELDPSGTVPEAFGEFVAARELLGRPVTISLLNGT